MRRRLSARADAGLARAPQRGDRLGRRQVQQVYRLLLVRGEGEVALDHDRLGDGRVAGEAELRRDAAFVHVSAARERLLLAVQRERPARRRRVLERAAHQPGRADRDAVVGEGDRAGVGELAHLRQLLPVLATRDRGEEADVHLRLATGDLDERAERRGRVDHGIGVGHGEDGAVAAGRGRRRSARDRLLVLAAGGAQMHVRVDERRREHEPGSVDDAVTVGVDALADGSDRARVDPHVEDRVDPSRRIDHPRAAHDEVVAGPFLDPQHHATSAAASARTPTGPPVSTS